MIEVFQYFQRVNATEQVKDPQTVEEFAIARAQEAVRNLFSSDVQRFYPVPPIDIAITPTEGESNNG